MESQNPNVVNNEENKNTQVTPESTESPKTPSDSQTLSVDDVFGAGSSVSVEPQPKEEPTKPKEEVPTPPQVQLGQKLEFQEPIKIESPDQVIGEVKPEKAGSPIFVVVLFVVLIVFAFGLPTFSDKITEYRNSKLPVAPNNPQNTENEPPVEEITKYPLDDNTNIAIGDINVLTFSFSKSNDLTYINYKISKKNEKTVVPNNLYIELYDANAEFIGRSKIYIDSQNETTTILELSSVIPEGADTTTKQIAILPKNEGDYPQRELEINESGTQTMTCQRLRQKVTYTFQDYFLIYIDEQITNIRGTDTERYNQELATHRALNTTIKNTTGATSDLVISDTGYTLRNTFDMSRASNIKSLGIVYFEPSTLARKIAFDLEASGYTCS